MNRPSRAPPLGCLVATLLLLLVMPLALAQPAGRSPNLRLLTTAPIRTESPLDRLGGAVAFQDDLLVAGVPGGPFLPSQDPGGFALFRILKRAPYLAQISSYTCGMGSDGAVAVWGDFVFLGVDNHVDFHQSSTCNNRERSDSLEQGVRIVEISDPVKPREVGFVAVGRAHNITLIPHNDVVYIYVPTPSDGLVPGLPSLSTRLRIVRFDPEHPRRARVVAEPRIFGQAGCHDLIYFAPRRVAACLGADASILLDVSDPPNPKKLSSLADTTRSLGFGAFSWDGRYLVASGTETLGFASTCSGEEDPAGVLWLYDVRDLRRPRLVTHYAPSRQATLPGFLNSAYACEPSRVSFVPTSDESYVVTSGWGSAGLTIVDFTVPTRPYELAFWAEEATQLAAGHWYNGRIYGTEMNRTGIRVFEADGLDQRHVHYFRNRYNPTSQIRDFGS